MANNAISYFKTAQTVVRYVSLLPALVKTVAAGVVLVAAIRVIFICRSRMDVIRAFFADTRNGINEKFDSFGAGCKGIYDSVGATNKAIYDSVGAANKAIYDSVGVTNKAIYESVGTVDKGMYETVGAIRNGIYGKVNALSDVVVGMYRD